MLILLIRKIEPAGDGSILHIPYPRDTGNIILLIIGWTHLIQYHRDTGITIPPMIG